ncbi:DUF433 domain-containing protein [Candidatus Woesearchaeota archaeon]|nr:DUF433 domain-containing protein [Candidatus Woesearchaeota archaeon]
MRINISKYIVADTKICGGTLTFNGTRIMLWQIFELLGAGVTQDEIIKDYFPMLAKSHIKAALHYAADLMRGDLPKVIVPLKP